MRENTHLEVDAVQTVAVAVDSLWRIGPRCLGPLHVVQHEKFQRVQVRQPGTAKGVVLSTASSITCR
jgi:hypothetical protein